MRAARRRHRRWAQGGARRRRLIFVDEFGTDLAMTRRYARAPRGRRARGHAPRKHVLRATLTLGLSRRSVVAPFAHVGGADGVSFATYVRTQLAPKLRRGDVVVLDGLGSHRQASVRAAIEARGARLRMLPPYSPDMTPVEQAGSKVKTALRAAAARTLPALYDAMGAALAAVTERDARHWFAHAGYGPRRRSRATGPPTL